MHCLNPQFLNTTAFSLSQCPQHLTILTSTPTPTKLNPALTMASDSAPTRPSGWRSCVWIAWCRTSARKCSGRTWMDWSFPVCLDLNLVDYEMESQCHPVVGMSTHAYGVVGTSTHANESTCDLLRKYLLNGRHISKCLFSFCATCDTLM